MKQECWTFGIKEFHVKNATKLTALPACKNILMPASYFKAIARDSSECNMILLFQDGEFNWNKLQQGSILSSTFWGYISTPMLGGYLANRFNAKHVIGWSLLISAVANILTPLAASFGFPYVIACRVITGLGNGVVFPSSYALFAHWAHPHERGTIVGIVNLGRYYCTPPSRRKVHL